MKSVINDLQRNLKIVENNINGLVEQIDNLSLEREHRNNDLIDSISKKNEIEAAIKLLSGDTSSVKNKSKKTK